MPAMQHIFPPYEYSLRMPTILLTGLYNRGWSPHSLLIGVVLRLVAVVICCYSLSGSASESGPVGHCNNTTTCHL